MEAKDMNITTEIQNLNKMRCYHNISIVRFQDQDVWKITPGGIINTQDNTAPKGVIVRSVTGGVEDEWLMLAPQALVADIWQRICLIEEANGGQANMIVQAIPAVGKAGQGSFLLNPTIKMIPQKDVHKLPFEDHIGTEKNFTSKVMQDGRMLWRGTKMFSLKRQPQQLNLVERFFRTRRSDLVELLEQGYIDQDLLQVLGLELIYNKARGDSKLYELFLKKQKTSPITIAQIIAPSISKVWELTELGTLARRNRKFYEGIIIFFQERADSAGEYKFMLRSLEQEEPTNGVIMLVLDRGKVWVQMKAEPGYNSSGCLGLTSTVQSSWTNIREKDIPFAQFLQQEAKIVVPVPQACDSFHEKLNEYRIVVTDNYRGNVPDNYYLASLAELHTFIECGGDIAEHLLQALGIAYIHGFLN